MMSHIIDYYSRIQDGKIPAVDSVKRQYEILANKAEHPDKYHLDLDIAKRHIDFIEKFCKQSQGVMGAPLKLELFQKAHLEAAFGFVDDNDIRQYTEVDIFEGRKNGKTTELAAVSLDLLCNDGEGAPEIYFIATKLDQAKKGFDEAERMRKHSPFLSKHLRKRASDIYFPYNEGIIKALASDLKKLDSYNSSGIIIDELGAITNRRIYDDMKQSTSSRRQPLLFCISTNNFVRNGIYDDQVKYGEGILNGTVKDEHILFIHYHLQDRDQWDKKQFWILANPGMGTIKKYDTLEAFVNKAKQDQAFKATVMVKDFNMTENAAVNWLEYGDAYSEETFAMEDVANSYAIGGCDLSSTIDLTCATLLLQKRGSQKKYVLQKYFLPESRLEEIMKKDVPEAPYRLWADQGWLHICEGTQVSYHDVSMWFYQMVENHGIRPLWIGYDRALAGYWVEEMEGLGFEMEKLAQGAFTWTYPMKRLGAEFHEHNVIYNKNPILLWNLMNTVKKSRNEDGIESCMPVKPSYEMRIDGTVSLLNAYTSYCKHEEEYMNFIAMKG